MVEDNEQPGSLEFVIPASGVSKRTDQLSALLTRSLRQEFGDASAALTVAEDPPKRTVRLHGLDTLDDTLAKKVVHRARVLFNEFMTSPWY